MPTIEDYDDDPLSGLAMVAKAGIASLTEARRHLDDRLQEALTIYEPLPFQERYHACRAKECLIQKATQAGGSLAGFAEVARAVTNQDPHNKYPKEGTAVCLGWGEGHIGRVIHKYLFRAGAFSMIRDATTGKWRTFRPWASDVAIDGKLGDAGREKEAKPAPPLIPGRFIKGTISWLKRSENIFSYVQFVTGWELYAFNSQGKADMGQGFQCDLYHIDEDVATDGWYVEAIGRSSIRKGLIRWTALPHMKTDDIVQMATRAEQEVGSTNPTTVCIRATMYDNPYFPEESKRHNEKVYREKGQHVYRQRVLGEMTMDTYRMYPQFERSIHTAIVELNEEELELEANGKLLRAKVQKILTELNGIPPQTWCRYMIQDPGFTIGGTLFFAVPPLADFGEFKIVYDELYIENCTAAIFGVRAKEKIRDLHFQDFIIDSHGGNLRDLGTGILPIRQYEQELIKNKIECEARGSRFLAGSDNIEGRELALRRWLEVRNSSSVLENGYPTLLVVTERCPNFCREITRFRKIVERKDGVDIMTDKGHRKANTHLVECAEYGAAHGLAWVSPPKNASPPRTVVEEILEGRKRRELRRRFRDGPISGNSINLGPKGDS